MYTDRLLSRQLKCGTLGGDGGLYSRAGASRDSRSVHASFKTAGGGEGKKSKLNGSGEASGVGYLACLGDARAVDFRKTVYVAARFITEVLGKVYDPQTAGHFVLLPE